MITRRGIIDIKDRQRGHQVGLVRLHQFKGLRRGEGTVLDGINPGADGRLDGPGGINVCGHLQAERVRRLDRHPHLLVRHQLLVGIVPGGGDATRRHELDHIGAPALVLAHAQPRLLGGVDDAVGPTGMAQAGIEPAARIPVARRRPQRFERDPQPRAGNFAGIDGIAHGDRVVTATDVPGAGETLLQHGPAEHRAVERPVDFGMSEPILRGVDLARQLAGDMHMTVDETRHDRLTGEIDAFDPGRRLEAGLDGGDAIVVNKNGNLLPGRGRDPVQQSAGVNDDIPGERRRGAKGHGERQKAAEKQ